MIIALVATLVADTYGDSIKTRVHTMLIMASLPVIVLAWMQYLDLVPVLFPTVQGYEQKVYSVFGNQNLLGGFIALGIPLAFYLLTHDEKSPLWLLGFLALTSATLLLTGSRTAWLAAALGVLATAPVGRPSRAIIFPALSVLCAGIVMFVAVPEATLERIMQSFSATDDGWNLRLWIWTGAANLIESHGLVGLGPGTFALVSPEALGDVLNHPGGETYHSNALHTWYAHSTPLDLLMDWGILGGVAVIGWFAVLVRNRESALFGTGIAFTVYAVFNSVLPSTPHLAAGLLIIVALAHRGDESPSLQIARAGVATILVVVSSITFGILAFHLIPDYHLRTARAMYTELGNTLETKEAYAWAAKSTPALPQSYLEYGILLLPQAPDQALKQFLAAQEGLDTGELHLLLSYAFEAENEPSLSLDHGRLATHRWPRESSAWRQRLRLEGVNAYAVWILESKRWLPMEEWERLGRELEFIED